MTSDEGSATPAYRSDPPTDAVRAMLSGELHELLAEMPRLHGRSSMECEQWLARRRDLERRIEAFEAAEAADRVPHD